MKLDKFRVEGLRCLVNTGWIPIRNTTIFTGQNDGGKTSALDALTLLLDKKAEVDKRDYTVTLDSTAPVDKIVVEGGFILSEDDKRILATSDGELHVKRELSLSVRSKYSYRTMVHQDERFRRNLADVPIGELTALADEFGIQLSNRRTKDIVMSEIRTWLASQQLVEGWLEVSGNLLERMPQIKVFESAEALDPEREINNTLRNSFSTRIRGEAYSGRLSEISLQIEKEMRQDLDVLMPIIKKYCPDVREVNIDPQFDYTSGFKTSRLLLRSESGPPIDLDKEGEGRKRKITLAVYEWRERIFSSQPTGDGSDQLILAFDEPDTHLDYLSQRKVFDIIKKIAQQEKVNAVVCTHSLNLIDRIPLTDVVHFELEGGKTRINTIEAESPELVDLFIYQLSDSMGLRNSVMLNERCFLVVEGLTEMGALPVLFSLRYGLSPQAAGVRIVNGEGGVGVKLFAKFLNDHRRDVLFMVDGDTRTQERGRYFTPESLTADGIDIDTQVHFIGSKEFEDCFSDEAYLRAAQTHWTKHDSSAWTIQEFSTLRSCEDFSEELVALIRRSVRKPISKPQIGYDVAKSLQNWNEIPPQLLSCIEHSYRLANEIR